VHDNLPAPVDEERFRQQRDAVLRRRDVVVVVHERVAEAVLAGELARVAGEVVHIHAEHDHLARPALRGGRERGRLLLARVAPGGPEVQHDDLPAQRRQLQRPWLADPLQREVRRRLPDRRLLAAALGELPDE
jgi:hypothetical protein